jgi:hypothetical protein
VPISTGYNELIIAGIQKGKTQKTEIEEEVWTTAYKLHIIWSPSRTLTANTWILLEDRLPLIETISWLTVLKKTAKAGCDGTCL